ncbi:MAG: roadblock/LC7 domain-containing protein [Bdellovibrionota bacterium]|nr:roadblock/LC7 domain-containing protein [Deltaproteobacteria bacterium]
MFEQEMNTVLSFLRGAKGILLMGQDGIAIEQYTKGSVENFEEISIEMSQILVQIGQITQQNELGSMKEMIFYTNKNTIMIHVMNHDIFLALLLDDQENLGKSRFALQKITPDIKMKLKL